MKQALLVTLFCICTVASITCGWMAVAAYVQHGDWLFWLSWAITLGLGSFHVFRRVVV